MRKETVVELDGPPAFDLGQEVRVTRVIRNDGTFPGKEIGDVLVERREIGTVASIGTFLQQFYVYGVYFPGKGTTVGCRAMELESLAWISGRERA
jgi:nitrogen fixation protein NifZ